VVLVLVRAAKASQPLMRRGAPRSSWRRSAVATLCYATYNVVVPVLAKLGDDTDPDPAPAFVLNTDKIAEILRLHLHLHLHLQQGHSQRSPSTLQCNTAISRRSPSSLPVT
jgi:hypothetical protein